MTTIRTFGAAFVLLLGSLAIEGCPPVAAECTSDTDCAGGTTCQTIDGGAKACVPGEGEGEGTTGEGEGAPGEGEGTPGEGEGEGEGEGSSAAFVNVPTAAPIGVDFQLAFESAAGSTCSVTLSGVTTGDAHIDNDGSHVDANIGETGQAHFLLDCGAGNTATADVVIWNLSITGLPTTVNAGDQVPLTGTVDTGAAGLDLTNSILCDVTATPQSQKSPPLPQITPGVALAESFGVDETSTISLECEDLNDNVTPHLQLGIAAGEVDVTPAISLTLDVDASPALIATVNATAADECDLRVVQAATPLVTQSRSNTSQKSYSLTLTGAAAPTTPTDLEVICFGGTAGVFATNDVGITVRATVTDDAGLTSLSTGSVKNLLGALGPLNPGALDLPNLERIAGDLNVQCGHSSALSGVSLQGLVTIAGELIVQNCDANAFSMSIGSATGAVSLTTRGLAVSGNPNLLHLPMPALTRDDGEFTIQNNGIDDVNFSGLTFISGPFSMSGDAGIFCNEIQPILSGLTDQCPSSIVAVDGGGTSCAASCP